MFRQPVKQQARNASKSYTVTAPVRGWILNEPLASSQPGGARLLENWFPTLTSARLRGGSLKYATISSGPVLKLFSYKSGNTEQFFASDETTIKEITTVADPDVIPSSVVSGRTSGYYSTAQFGTVGGDFLYAVNGTDNALLYDGSTWTPINTVSSPAITGVATASLEFVWVFSSRLFFIEKDSMNAWFLPVDSIGGAAQKFSLAGIFQNGGSLLFGGKWSLDAGNGLDDKCVFVSTEGEVAIYQGTDPASASNWTKVGVYQITPPMGPNCTMSAGGDFLIGTEDGIVPISEAVNKDVAALSLAAVTRQIEPEWRKEVVARRTVKWEILKWPSNNMMVVSLPIPDTGISPYCFVANLETGAWCKFTPWETNCLGLYDNFGFFGSQNGCVYQMEVGGSDDGTSYTCTYVGLPDHMKTPGAYKTVYSARSVFLTSVPFIVKISVSTNYQINLPTAPSSTTDYSVSEWDSGLWDVSQWDAGTVQTAATRWQSVGRSGFAISPQIQITCGVTPFPRTELVAFDLIYERGGVLV